MDVNGKSVRVGVAVHERTVPETLEVIRKADDLGVKAAWLTTGGIGTDAIPIFAAAAVLTRQIMLGTAITPTYPRHPLATAQEALAVAPLASGRFRLGVGPSHRPAVEAVFGIPFDRPLEHLREYVIILKQALQRGKVDFDGEFFHVHGQVTEPPGTPVLISALRPGSYRLAGEYADGAISWVTPSHFLRDRARPALEAGAAKRSDGVKPILVGHAFAIVSTDQSAVLAVGRERLAGYARLPFYQEMFAAAGFPEARQGTVSQGMIDNIVISGDEKQVAEGIHRFAESGVDELIISLVNSGRDQRPQVERTLQVIAGL